MIPLIEPLLEIAETANWFEVMGVILLLLLLTCVTCPINPWLFITALPGLILSLAPLFIRTCGIPLI